MKRRQIMRMICVLVVPLSLGFDAALAQTCNTADLLAGNAAARGGSDAIEAIHSLQLNLTITEPTFQVQGLYRATRDGKMRIDIFADGERVFTEAYDGQHGWQLLGGAEAAVDMSAEGEAAVKRGIAGNIYGLHEWPALGYRFDDCNEVTVDGERYITFDVVDVDGFRQRIYVDPATYLVVREREESALHPDVNSNERQVESHVLDYRAVDGVLFSMKGQTIDLASGQVVQTTVVDDLTVNPVLEPDIFKRP